MIQLYECPTCGQDTAALAEVVSPADISATQARFMCPACAPISGDRARWDFKPVMLAGIALEDANLISGVCCGDSGDCDHECGIA